MYKYTELKNITNYDETFKSIIRDAIHNVGCDITIFERLNISDFRLNIWISLLYVCTLNVFITFPILGIIVFVWTTIQCLADSDWSINKKLEFINTNLITYNTINMIIYYFENKNEYCEHAYIAKQKCEEFFKLVDYDYTNIKFDCKSFDKQYIDKLGRGLV